LRSERSPKENICLARKLHVEPKITQIAPAEIGEAQKAYDQAREVYQELIRNLVRRTDTYKSDARRPWIGTPTQGQTIGHIR
jgi:hypothetical protein